MNVCNTNYEADYLGFNLFLATHLVDVNHSQPTWGVCEVCGEDFDQDAGTCYFAAKKSFHGFDKPLVIVCHSCDPNYKESYMDHYVQDDDRDRPEDDNYGHSNWCPVSPCICHVSEKEAAELEEFIAEAEAAQELHDEHFAGAHHDEHQPGCPDCEGKREYRCEICGESKDIVVGQVICSECW